MTDISSNSKASRRDFLKAAAITTAIAGANLAGGNAWSAQTHSLPSQAATTQALKFKGKVALVTGSTSGIGRASAVEFAKNGATVIVTGRNEVRGQETLDLIRQTGGDGAFIKADLLAHDQLDGLFDQILSRYGRLDFAHNNAGITGQGGPFTNYSLEEARKVFGTNIEGVWLCMQREIAQMQKQGKGVIVNTTSTLGYDGVAYIPAYVASKHAIDGMTNAVSAELASQNIRVCSVAPGPIDTPMIQSYIKDDAAAAKFLASKVAMKRLGKPEEVAKAVVWLCSDDASFVTGTPLFVDGGTSVFEPT